MNPLRTWTDLADNRRKYQSLRLEHSSNQSQSISAQLNYFFPDIPDREDLEVSLPKGIVIPESCVDLFRNLAIGMMSAYIVVMVPYNLAFSHRDSNGWILSLFLFLDIVVTFNTAYFDSGALIVKRSDIACHYFKGWFWLDLLATLPLDLLTSFTLNETSLTKVPKFLWGLRLFRLANLVRIPKFLRAFEEFISSNMVSAGLAFAKPLSITLLSAHWSACALIYIGLNSKRADRWYVGIDELIDMNETVMYITALYWMITTAVAMGYGDITALNPEEKIILMCYTLVSSALYSYTLAEVVSLITKLKFNQHKHRETINAINTYLKRRQLPLEIRIRVKHYIDYRWELDFDEQKAEDKLMDVLSVPLKHEVYSYTRGPTINTCPIFREFEGQKLQLSNLLALRIFSIGDVVFDEGETSDEIYFVTEGTAQIYHRPSDSVFKILKLGSYFGEIAFFTKRPRSASVKCIDYMQSYYLSRARVEVCFEESPEAKAKLSLLTLKARIDLNCLGIKCYTCEKAGHVALHCKMMQFQFDRENLAEKWVRSRHVNTKLVNQHWHQPAFKRKGHYSDLKQQYSCKNVKIKQRFKSSNLELTEGRQMDNRRALSFHKFRLDPELDLSAILSESEQEEPELSPTIPDTGPNRIRKTVILDVFLRQSTFSENSSSQGFESSFSSDVTEEVHLLVK